MGLFDIFKKKPNNTDEENILETTLRKAATDPVFRAEFYKRLLSEKLVVLTDKTLPEGHQIVRENTEVNIATLADGKIPVFTSTRRIFDKGIIKEEVPFLELKGEDLFNLATGATFILNPYSDYGKELLPNEIANIINGTFLTEVQIL